MHLRVGEPLLLTKSLGDAANGADVVIDSWSATNLHALRREIDEALRAQLPDHASRAVAWGNAQGLSIREIAYQMLDEVFVHPSCRCANALRGDYRVPVVTTTQRGRNKAGAAVEETVTDKLMYPTVWVELERDRPNNAAARVAAMRVGFPVAPSCVRLCKQVLSMSIPAGAGRVVVHMKAHSALMAEDRGNVLAHVGLTRTSCLGDVAITSESVLTREMFAPAHELKNLLRWVDSHEGWTIEYRYTAGVDGAVPNGEALDHHVNDGDADIFENIIVL